MNGIIKDKNKITVSCHACSRKLVIRNNKLTYMELRQLLFKKYHWAILTEIHNFILRDSEVKYFCSNCRKILEMIGKK